MHELVDQADRTAVALVTAALHDENGLLLDALVAEAVAKSQVHALVLVLRLTELTASLVRNVAPLIDEDPVDLFQKIAVALAAAQQPPQPQAGEDEDGSRTH